MVIYLTSEDLIDLTIYLYIGLHDTLFVVSRLPESERFFIL